MREPGQRQRGQAAWAPAPAARGRASLNRRAGLAAARPEVMPSGTPTAAAAGSSSRTRWRAPRSAPFSSSSVTIPIANATAGRICSGHQSESCRSQFPARIRRPPRTTSTCSADLRQSRASGIGKQPDQHVASVRVQLVPAQVAGEEPGSGLAVQRRDKQPFPVIGRDLPGQRSGRRCPRNRRHRRGCPASRRQAGAFPARGPGELPVMITLLQDR